MNKKIFKDHLSDEQKKSLKELHSNQITLEVALTIFLVSILTINISSAVEGYGILALLAMMISGVLLFVCGIVFSKNVLSLKRLGKPLARSSKTIKRWLIFVWLCIPVGILILMTTGISNKPEILLLLGVLFGGVVFVMLASIIMSLIGINRVWRRFTKKKSSHIRVITYGSIAFILLMLSLFGSYTTTEVVKYVSSPVSDSNLELGQTEIRQAGKNGEKQIKHNLLFGIPLSTSTTEPVDEIIAKGSRRYQYMYCSDGSYRYYNAEQFKDPNVGFTHQSPDYCAKNGAGAQTTIADVPPAEKIVQQVPVYRAPAYTSPSYTTCRSYSFDNSFSCTTY